MTEEGEGARQGVVGSRGAGTGPGAMNMKGIWTQTETIGGKHLADSRDDIIRKGFIRDITME